MNLAIVYKLHTKFTYKQKLPLPNASTPVLCRSGKTSSNSSVHSVTEAVPLPQLNGNKVPLPKLNNNKVPLPQLNGNNVNNHNTNATNTSNNNINPEGNSLIQQQDQSFLSVRPIQRYKRTRDNRSPSSSPPLRHMQLYHGNTSIRIRSTQCRATASAKTTKMLLAASTVFLIFNLPYHLLLFCFLFIKQQPPWMFSAVNIARFWFFASFCVNFFVYAIWGQRFRSEVVRLFSCLFLGRYCTLRHQNKLKDRQNSMYLSHRLLPASFTHLSHSN
jgi:hypothetical protein